MTNLETLNKLYEKAGQTPLAKRLLRRNVKDIEGYMKWEAIVNFFDTQRKAHYFINALGSVENLPKDITIPKSYFATIKAVPSLYIDECVAPIIHVDKALINAMLLTDIPKNISQSIKKVYPSIILLLPENSLVVDGRDFGAIYVRYSEASEGTATMPLIQPPHYEKDTLYSEFSIKEIKVVTNETVLNIVAIDRNSNFCVTGTVSLNPSRDDYLDMGCHEYDKAIAEALRAISIQTYLMLEHKPELATESLYHPQNKQEARQCRLSPVEPTRWLGINFSLGKENSLGEPTRFAIKQKIHWRRGHWRNQPYGSKLNPKIKTIWVEPYLVGIDKSGLLAA